MTTLPPIKLETVSPILLETQGLRQPFSGSAVKADVLKIIRQMGALQIDTISVVARSPYFVLWSRLGAYRAAWLDELLAEGALFEYWAHAACFLPIENYPLYVHRMQSYAEDYRHGWVPEHIETIERVLNHMRLNGPVRSADFERTDGKKGSWWDWKEEKQALEYLHTSGQAMIARRDKFQRVYDLRERILPGWDEQPPLEADAAITELALLAVRCLGITPARWVPDYFRLPKTGIQARLESLVDQGRLLRAQVEDSTTPWYIHPDQLPVFEAARQDELQATYTSLLSPFDPLIWDRERTRVLFGMDYSIECYLPQPKRVYGYFNLPILHRGKLVGRLDPKAHRQDGIFEIRALHLEANLTPDDTLAQDLADCLTRCAAWHGTPQVRLALNPETTAPAAMHLAEALQSRLPSLETP